MKQNKGTNPMVENWFQQPHPSPFTSVWTEAKIQVSATKKPSYHKNTGICATDIPHLILPFIGESQPVPCFLKNIFLKAFAFLDFTLNRLQ
ncbi:MAG: hypothetical protein IKA80_09340 [Spirochaetaceae bacterium]|nr:hypothetical protein [Spirochaetaceae bacterium]MBR2362831.1 hypothetical protein [Spirochaetaceae bacterium]